MFAICHVKWIIRQGGYMFINTKANMRQKIAKLLTYENSDEDVLHQ